MFPAGNQSATMPKAQVFVTASPTAPGSVKTEPVSTTAPIKTEMGPPTSVPPLPSVKAEAQDPGMALLKLHELAVANKLVER